jgi:hypothetical protein
VAGEPLRVFPFGKKEGGGYAFDPKARGISTKNIEHVICFGSKEFVLERREARTVHTARDLTVVTTRGNRIVVTCMYTHQTA